MHCIEDTEINLVPQVTSARSQTEGELCDLGLASLLLTLLFFSAYGRALACVWVVGARGSRKNAGCEESPGSFL